MALPSYKQREIVVLAFFEVIEKQIEGQKLTKNSIRAWKRAYDRSYRIKNQIHIPNEKEIRKIERKAAYATSSVGFDSRDVQVVDALHFLLFLAETVRLETKKARDEWAMLCQSLFTCIRNLDAKWDDPKSQEQIKAEENGLKFWEKMT